MLGALVGVMLATCYLAVAAVCPEGARLVGPGVLVATVALWGVLHRAR